MLQVDADSRFLVHTELDHRSWPIYSGNESVSSREPSSLVWPIKERACADAHGYGFVPATNRPTSFSKNSLLTGIQ